MMKPTGRAAEQPRFLFEINVDTAKKDGRTGALISFIQSQRQIERHHEHLVPQSPQGSDQRIIAQAIAAIHAAGARGKLKDLHGSCLIHLAPKQYTRPSSDPMTILPPATAGEL